MRPHRTPIFGLVVVGWLVFAAAPAAAQTTNTWNGTSSIFWTDGANWSGGVPVDGQIVLFNSAAPNTTVNLITGSSAVLDRVQFQGAGVASYNLESGNLRIQDGGFVRISNTAAAVSQTVTMTPQFQGSGSVTNDVAGATLNLANVSNTAAGTLTVGAIGPINISGTISGGGLSKTGAGTATLTGNNTYTGSTTITGGVLSVSILDDGGSSSGIGASSNAAANLVLDGGTLRYTGAGDVIDRLFTVGPAGGTLENTGGGNLNMANTGPVGYSSPGTARTLTLAISSDISYFSASIGDAGGGAVGLTKTGAGAWSLVNGTNTYTGPTTIQGGTLRLQSASSAAASSVYTVDAALLLLPDDPTTFTVGSLAGVGAVTGGGVSGTTATLSAGGNGTSTTFSGLLQDLGGIFGGLAVTKAGGGTMTLTGANTYTSGTQVNAGTLLVNNTTGSGTGSGAVDVNGPTGTLGGTGTIGNTAGPVAINSGGKLSPGASVGKLTTGAETWNAGGSYTWEISDPAGAAGTTGWDLVELNAATLTVGASQATPFTINIVRVGAGAAGVINPALWFTIAHAGTVSGFSADKFVLPDPGGGDQWEIRQIANPGGGFDIQVGTVPEPGTLWLLSLGAAAMLRRRRLSAIEAGLGPRRNRSLATVRISAARSWN